ncbi:MAG: BspA family leucine-rich repeat surface protein, partial [Candidatus Limisoma sp.]
TMFCMFENCSALKSLDLKSFDTSNVTDMNGMFRLCSSLSSLDLSNFDTSKVTDMYCMFDSCSSLSSLDLSSFDTSKVASMGFMFSSCSSLSSLDLKNFDTSNVTDMYRMFYSCSSLSSLDLSSFDTSKVTDMSNMFDSCTSLSSLDLSSFDTSNVTGMTSMFKGCKFTSIDVSNFNTEKVTDMSYMFSSCSSLSSLDLSNFDTSKVSDMDYLFYNCSNLTTIYCKDDWNSYVVSTSDDMFKGCTSLKGAVAYDASKVDVSMANPTTGYFAVKEAYVVEKGTTLTFYYDHNKATRTGIVYGIDDLIEGTSYPAWAGWTIEDNDRITKAVFDNSFKQYKPTSTQEWFNCCTKLESVEGIENLNTEEVTNMAYMFCSCSSLKSLDLSSLNTSNVLYLDNMFNDCSALQSINLTNINTEKVTTLNGMFYGCSSLTTLDLSTFNTANVTDLSWTFCSCYSLRTIYCNDDWNTSTVQYSDSMFDGCTSLNGAVAYNSSKVDASMANPTTGYFTKKDGGVESLESEAVPAARRGIYNLQGIKMQGSFDQLPAGFYIVNGQKVFKK